MDIWSSRALASLDFTARTVALVRPSEAIVRRELDIERLSMAERAALKDRLLTDHLPIEQMTIEPRDAITAELVDFADSMQIGRAAAGPGEGRPRRGRRCRADYGEDGVPRLGRHARRDGRPQVAPARQIIPGPHWGASPRPGRPNGAKRDNCAR